MLLFCDIWLYFTNEDKFYFVSKKENSTFCQYSRKLIGVSEEEKFYFVPVKKKIPFSVGKEEKLYFVLVKKKNRRF